MITRPLDLASLLRPAPRSFDAFFYVNVGALALFFMVFGSRFVLAPGVTLPRFEGSASGATTATCHLSVLRSGQIFTEDGLLSRTQLREWLAARARQDRSPALLIKASDGVTLSALADIQAAAVAAGFRVILGAEDPDRALVR